MGKGDKRTKRGKIFKGSFGNTRPQKVKSSATGVAKAAKTKKTVKKSKQYKKRCLGNGDFPGIVKGLRVIWAVAGFLRHKCVLSFATSLLDT